MTCRKCKAEMKRDIYEAAGYIKHVCPVCLSYRIIVLKKKKKKVGKL